MVTADIAPAVSESEASAWRAALPFVIAIALARIVLYLFIAPNYGYFRDELYYLACGEHPAWGYVDQPPVVAWVAWLLQHTIGTSLYALRLTPALAGAATCVLSARLAWEFGARKFGIWLAAIAVLLAPVNLSLTHLFTMNAYDLVLWTLCSWLLVRIFKTGNQRLWLVFGVVAGVTILNKYGVVFFLAALAIGVLLTSHRRVFASGYFWAGVALCSLISLPNFLWQYHRGFPFIELMRNIRASGRDVELGPIGFIGQQLLLIAPIAALLVVAAVVFFFTRAGRPYRALGWSYIAFVLLLFVLKTKSYYVAPIYPMIFAAGATGLEQWTQSRKLKWIQPTYAALLIVSGLLLAPLAAPVLPVHSFIAYQRWLGLEPPKTENQPQGPLPQLYADMYGWPEIAQATAKYYNALPEEERKRTAIFSNNYGDGGAIDFFGPKLGLPKAIGGHQNYYFWGPRQYTGESLIIVNESRPEELAKKCASITLVSEINHPLARPDENRPIYHCRGLKWNLQEIWPSLKHWN